MKRLFLLTLFAAIASLSSCDGNEGTISQARLTGNWQWVESVGGIAGTTETPSSTGNEIMLEITPASIKKFTNGTLTKMWPYTIASGQSIFGGNRLMVIYEDDSAPQSFTVVEDELVLTDECHDCYENRYVRIGVSAGN